MLRKYNRSHYALRARLADRGKMSGCIRHQSVSYQLTLREKQSTLDAHRGAVTVRAHFLEPRLTMKSPPRVRWIAPAIAELLRPLAPGPLGESP